MYERPTKNRKEFIPFEVGIHQAKIEQVYMTTSKTGRDMFKLKIVGEESEIGFAYLVFGNRYAKENLNYLLASIEDNGVEVPNIEFGYTQETVLFLTGKPVFIEVKEQLFHDRKQRVITGFLTLEEIETATSEVVVPSEEEENSIW